MVWKASKNSPVQCGQLQLAAIPRRAARSQQASYKSMARYTASRGTLGQWIKSRIAGMWSFGRGLLFTSCAPDVLNARSVYTAVKRRPVRPVCLGSASLHSSANRHCMALVCVHVCVCIYVCMFVCRYVCMWQGPLCSI